MKFYKVKHKGSKHYAGDVLVGLEVTGHGKAEKVIHDIYVSKKYDGEDKLQTTDEDHYFKVIPLKKPDELNQISMYVCGCSGSGKSWFVGETVRRLQKYVPHYKKFDVFLVSGQPIDLDDPAFETNIREYKRIDLNHPDFVRIGFRDLEKSICIFDDISALGDEPMEKHINNLQKSILQNARKSEIININIGHTLQDYLKTKYILEESVYLTVFPLSDYDVIRNFFLTKMCYRNELVQYLLNLDTRALTIHKHYPQYYVSDFEMGMLNPRKKK